MAIGPGIEGVGGPIVRLFGEGSASGMDEGELLRRFSKGRDAVALEVLVARHGPMVLGVCRRVLGDRHSSEDAFQATFLVLAKRAGSIRDPDRLGPWLHGVAHRVAVRARADLARRNARERPGAEDLAMETSAGGDDPGFDRQELRAALDEEVRRLPEKFRDPIVLCYLDGLTHDEAAVRLRCPVGTVRSRLSTGRARLRDRLARRGVAVPSGVFAAVLTAEAAEAAVSLPLLVSTVKAATAFAGGLAGATAAGMVSAGAASLAEGVSTTMILTKLKIVGGAALAGMLTLGLGTVAAYQAGGPGPVDASKPDAPAATSKAQVEDAEAKVEIIKRRINQAEADVESSKAQLKEVQAELDAARDRIRAARPTSPDGQAVFEKRKMDIALGYTVETQELKAELQKTRAELAVAQAQLKLAMRKDATARKEAADPFAEVPAPAPKPAPNPAPLITGSGMGGGMDGMMGMGGGRAPKSLATIQGNDYVIVHKPKSDKVAAYSATTGEWTSCEVPKGVDVVPIAGPGVVALMATGESIGQVAAYAPGVGRWARVELKEPARGKATPIVAPGQAVYAIGRYVYAFSGSTASWDVLELPEGANPTPIVAPNRSTVEHDDHLYMFSVKTGKWSDFDAKAGQPTTPGAK